MPKRRYLTKINDNWVYFAYINQSYKKRKKDADNANEIYDCACGAWTLYELQKLGITPSNISYVFAIKNDTVKAIYKVSEWIPRKDVIKKYKSPTCSDPNDTRMTYPSHPSSRKDEYKYSAIFAYLEGKNYNELIKILDEEGFSLEDFIKYFSKSKISTWYNRYFFKKSSDDIPEEINQYLNKVIDDVPQLI